MVTMRFLSSKWSRLGLVFFLVLGLGLLLNGLEPVRAANLSLLGEPDVTVITQSTTWTTNTVLSGDLLITDGAVLTLTQVRVQARNITVTAGSAIVADGTGYSSGGGPGAGAYSWDAGAGGGSHGGRGSVGAHGATGGEGYDSVFQPTMAGSGGGNRYDEGACGGAGGGAVHFQITGTLRVDGRLSADGMTGAGGRSQGCGGGGGGSLWVEAAQLIGAGIIRANGGAASGSNDRVGGGGGGGRIALDVDQDLFSGTVQARGGWGYYYGGAGTIYRTALDQIRVDNGGNNGLAAILTPALYDFDSIALTGYGHLTLLGTTSTLTLAQQTVTGDGSARLTGYGLFSAPQAFSVTGATLVVLGDLAGPEFLTVTTGAGLELYAHTPWRTGSYTFTSLSVAPTGTLTLISYHNGDTVYLDDYGLDLHIGDLTVAALGLLTLDGKGYNSGGGPGAGAYSWDAGAGGGSHGGRGSVGAHGATGGEGYDSVFQPTMAGSGGGNRYDEGACGGAGGGAVHFQITGTLRVDGRLSADGMTGVGGRSQGCGGGGGGSLWIEAAQLIGAGIIRANGGAASGSNDRVGGGGGGGRIALEVDQDLFSGTVQARGGWGYYYGGAGTIYWTALDQIRVDNGGNNGLAAILTPALYDFDSIALTGYGHLTLLGTTSTLTLAQQTVTGDGSARLTGYGLFSAPQAFSVTGATLVVLGDLAGPEFLTVTTGAGLELYAHTPWRTGSYTFTSLSVAPTGTLTLISYHNGDTVYLDDYGLDLHIGDLTVAALGLLTLDGKGYNSGGGPGAGAYSWDAGAGGGSHGGRGSVGAHGATGGEGYDSVFQPTMAGSGGGNRYDEGACGGAGGGAVHFQITGTLRVDGRLSADGMTGVGGRSQGCGGGGGGSLWIEAAQLIGAGIIRANGGAASGSNDRVGGGGGGGRIALDVDQDLFSGTVQARGGWGYYYGGAGTIYWTALDQIRVDNGGNNGLAAILTPALYDFDSIALTGYGHLTLLGTTSTLTLAQQTVTGDGSARLTGYGLFSAPQAFSVTGMTLVVLGDLAGPEFLTVTTGAGLELYAHTPWRTGSYTFTSLSVAPTGTLTLISYHNGDTVYLDDYGLDLHIKDLTVAALGLLTLDGKGYNSGGGPGAGAYSWDAGAGGGAHGGQGSSGGGGAIGGEGYDSVFQPTMAGSGGGNRYDEGACGGAGGGAVHFQITGTLAVDGRLSADGMTGVGGRSQGCGGGGGGSLWIEAAQLIGAGVIRANGGDASGYDGRTGGGGGGGRIALDVDQDLFSGTVLARGGWGYSYGGAGTIYRTALDQIWVDNGGNNGTAAILTPGDYAFSDIRLTGYGHLTVMSSTSVLTITESGIVGDGSARLVGEGRIVSPLDLTINGAMLVVKGELNPTQFITLTGSGGLELWAHTPWHSGAYTFTEMKILPGTTLRLIPYDNGDTDYNDDYGVELNLDRLLVDTGGSIVMDELGYNTGRGLGAGVVCSGGGYDCSGGAGHGNKGGQSSGLRAGGVAYGDLYHPVTLGSGGGWCDSYAGSGGGAAHLRVSDTLIVSGTISANGDAGGNSRFTGTGGGSGGSLWIETARLLGNGTIRANGGSATVGGANTQGGGGAGGRIAVYVGGQDMFAGSYQVAGGWGYQYGGAGTLFLDVIDPLTSTAVIAPDNLTADGVTTATVTVTLLTGGGYAVSGKPVALELTSGPAVYLNGMSLAAGVKTPIGISDDSGQVTAVVTTTRAAVRELTAWTGDVRVVQPAVVTFTAGAPDLQMSLLRSDPGQAAADGSAAADLMVRIVDRYNNPVPGVTVVLTDNGSHTVLIQPAGPTNVNGWTNGAIRGSWPETVTVQALVGGVPLSATAAVQFIAADLGVLKEGPAEQEIEKPVTYTLSVKNYGLMTATATLVTDTLPVTMRWISQTSPFTFMTFGNLGVWEIGDLGPGAEVSIQAYAWISATTPPFGTLVNQVEVGSATPDGKLSNNTATRSTTATPPAPRLEISPTYPTLIVPVGETERLTLTIRNAGSAVLLSPVVTLPVHIPWLTLETPPPAALQPGEIFTLTVIAAPPAGLQPGRYRDLLRVSGTDVSPKSFALTIQAQAPLRDMRLAVINNGGAPVPGANVRLAETIYVETEGQSATETFYREVLTGPGGVLTATELESGDFAYHIMAAGHQPGDGVFIITPGTGPQTVTVELIADLSLAWSPHDPQLTVMPGQGALMDIEVRNTSVVTLSHLNFIPPTTPEWVYLGDTGAPAILPPGGSFTLTLHARPPEAIPAAVYSGTLGVQADGGVDVSIPFGVRVTLSPVRSLQVTVIDEDGKPVPDAELQLVGQQTNLVVSGTVSNTMHETYFGQTDNQGQDFFPDMTVGWYSYYVSRRGYTLADGALEVEPGGGTQEEVIVVPATGLDVSWSVTPTPFEDIYTATLQLVFDPNAPHPAPGLGPGTACFSESQGLTIYNAYPVTIENAELKIEFSCSVSYTPTLGDIPPNSSFFVPVTFGADCCADQPDCSRDPKVQSGVATLTGGYHHLLRAPLYSAAAPLHPYIQPGSDADILVKLVNEGYPANGNLYGEAGSIRNINLSQPRVLDWITVTPDHFDVLTPQQEVDFYLHVDVPEWLQVGTYSDAVIITTGDGVTMALQIDAKMEPNGLTVETQFVTPLRPDGSGGPGDPHSGVEGGWDAPPWWNAEVPQDYPEEYEPIRMDWPLSRTCCRGCPHDPVHYWAWLGNVWTETKLGPYGFPSPHLSGSGLVYLEIVQRISLERQAFTAQMVLRHQGTFPVEDISADLVVKDVNGLSWVVPAGAAEGGFIVTPTLPTDLGDLSDGRRKLASWVLIPDRLPYDPETDDPFSPYVLGGHAFLDQLGTGHSSYAQASGYVDQLDANVAQAQSGGDTEALRLERRELTDQLNQLSLNALGRSFDNFTTAATFVPDDYTDLENAVQQLLDRLDPADPVYTQTLQLKAQLDANIAQARQSGDTPALKAERNSLNQQLDTIAREALNIGMDQLSQLSGRFYSSEGKVYMVQAYLSYVVNGEHFVIHTQEEPIVVKPEPFVWIDYFMPRYVWAGEPFKLWAMATNFGYGEARNLKINSAQPHIVRNDSGLPIHFEIVSDLEVDFGDLQPEQSLKRFWEIVPSHDGAFISFNAVCEHADYLGLKLSEQVYCNGNAHIIDNPPTNEAGNWGEDSSCAVSQVQARRADPVNTYSGNFSYNAMDVSIPTWGEPLMLERSYNSRDTEDGPFGAGWTHNYDLGLTYRSFLAISDGVPADSFSSLMEFKAPRGSRLYYTVEKDGSFTPYPGVKAALLRHLGTYTVTLGNQITYVFDAKQRLVRAIDANGNAQEMTYDDDDNLIRVTDPAGRVLAFTYNEAHHITTMTDPLGRVTRYDYDAYGTLEAVTDPSGSVTHYTYAGAGGRRQLNSIIDPNGNVTAYNQYDNKGRVISQRDGAGNTTTFSYGDGVTTMTDPLGYSTWDYYNDDGLLVQAKDAYGYSEFYEYDADYNQRALVDKKGRRTEYSWDSCGCSMTGIRESLGRDTGRSFDGLHRLTRLSDAEGRTTTYQYGRYADPITVTNPLHQVTTFSYGSHGEMLSMTDPAGRTTAYTYDAYGNMTRSVDSLGQVTEMAYDAAGRMLSTTNPRGYTTRFVYDPANRLLTLTDPLSGTKSYTYDAAGNRLTEVNANGYTTTYAYDTRNLQIRMTDPVSGVTRYQYDALGRKRVETDANGHATTLVYDRLGRVSRVIDPLGGVRIFTFDPVGNTLSETDPESRTTHYTYDAANRVVIVKDALNNSVTFTYDRVGNQLTATDSRGRVVHTTYDALDRPVRIVTHEVDGVFDPDRPDEDNVTIKHYDAAGNLAGVTDTLGRTLFTEFDGANRPVRAILNEVDGIYDPARPDEDLITRNAYDAAGNVISTTNPAGFTTLYSYDALNRRLTERNALGGTTVRAYDAVGNLIAVTDAGGQTTRYTYDGFNRQIAVTDPLSGTSRVEYDGVGNRTAEIDALGHVRIFEYDEGDRLIRKEDALGRITRYTYDGVGNQLSATDPEGAVIRFSYNDLNRLVAVTDPLSHTTSFIYDVLGNQILQQDAAGRVTYYEYDGLNRLVTTTNALSGTIVTAYDGAGNKISVTDPAGRVVRFVYDQVDRPVRSIDPAGGETILRYDALGQIVQRVDPAGRTTTFAYDALGRLITTMNALSGTAVNAYDAIGLKVATTDADGHTTTYAYDAAGRLITTTDALSATTVNAYDAVGNLTATTDALGRVTRFTYDAENQLTGSIDPRGGQSSFRYDRAGRRIEVTDPNGHTTATGYDAAGRRISITDALSRTHTTAYDAVGNPVAETDGNGHTVRFTYDALNRLVLSTDALGQGTRFLYDAVDRQIATVDAGGYTTTFGYDSLGRLITTTDPLSGVVLQAYDAVGNRLWTQDAEGHVTRWGYDALNRLVTTTDALSGTTVNVYDAMGNLIATTDAAGRMTRLAYDAADRPVTVTDALSGTTVNVYDAVGNRIARIDAAGYTTEYGYDGLNHQTVMTDALGHAEYREYDPAGNLTAITDANGQTRHYRYDAANQRIEEEDASGYRTFYAYDGVGNTTTMTDAGGFVTRTQYDAANRVAAVIDPAGKTTAFAYNALGYRSAMTDAVGHATTFSYDPLGRLTATRDARGGVEQRRYDAAGNLTGLTDAAGHATTYAYDALNRPVTTTDALSGTVVAAYDAVGNLTAVTDSLGRRTVYGYDALNRRIATTDPLSGTTLEAYDAVGNRILLTDPNGHTTFYQYDAVNRLVQVTDPLSGVTRTEYDAAGNPVALVDAAGRVSTIAYDAANRPVTVTDALSGVTLFAYDGLGNKVAVTDAEGRVTRSTYDHAGRLLTTTDAAGQVARQGYDPVGNRLWEQDAAGRVTGYAYDELNRMAVMTDALGSPTFYRYDAVGNRTALTDPNGYTTVYHYDALNRLDVVTNPLSGTTRTVYDAAGNPVVLVDAAGRVTTMAYDAADRLVTVTNALSGTTVYGYDRVGNRLAVVDAEGRRMAWGYDGLNRVAVMTDALGGLTRYAYDAVGNLIRVTDPAGHAVDTAYDGLDRATAMTDTLGQAVAFAYDRVGNRMRVTDATGAITQTAYDLLNRPVAETDPLNRATLYGYDAVGNLTVMTDATGAATVYVYDGLNRRLQESDPLGNFTAYGYDRIGNQTVVTDARQIVTRYEYDPLNRLTGVVENFRAGEGGGPAVNVRTAYGYDAVGNRTVVTDANQHATTNAYDALNRLIRTADPLGNAYQFTYDGVGNLTRRVDARGITATYRYDVLNRPVELAYAEGQVLLSYDAVGNRTLMTDTTGVTRYEYDPVYQLTAVTDPTSGTVRYTYDAAGRRTALIYPDGKTTAYRYDAAGQLVTATGWISQPVTYRYDAAGRPIQAALPNGVETAYRYDAAGRLVGLEHTRGVTTLARYEYGLDEVGNRVVVTETLHRMLAADFTATPRSGMVPLAVTFTSQTSGTIAGYRWDFGDGTTGSGAQAVHTYAQPGTFTVTLTVTNAEGLTDTLVRSGYIVVAPKPLYNVYLPIVSKRVTAVLEAAPMPAAGSPVGDRLAFLLTDPTLLFLAPLAFLAAGGRRKKGRGFTWTVSALLMVVALVGLGLAFTAAPAPVMAAPTQQEIPQGEASAESTSGTIPAVRTIHYTYDPLYRLTEALYSSGEHFTYTYDPVGNRLTAVGPGGLQNYSYDAADRLTQVNGVTYAWDANGNLINDGVRNFVYDSANRLVDVISGTAHTEYSYAGDGVRLAQTVNGVTTRYVMDRGTGLPQVLQEQRGAATQSYLYGNELLGSQDSGGWAYHLPDALGSVRQIADVEGRVTTVRVYDPFGQLTAQEGQPTGSFGYAGEQFDPAAGLQFLRARYYDPGTGRFISRDPYPAYAVLPATLHRYAYASNNPVNMTDPSGLFSPQYRGRLRGLQAGQTGARLYYRGQANVSRQQSVQRRIDAGQRRFAAATGGAQRRIQSAQAYAVGRIAQAQQRFSNLNSWGPDTLHRRSSWAFGRLNGGAGNLQGSQPGRRTLDTGSLSDSSFGAGNAGALLPSAPSYSLPGFAGMARPGTGLPSPGASREERIAERRARNIEDISADYQELSRGKLPTECESTGGKGGFMSDFSLKPLANFLDNLGGNVEDAVEGGFDKLGDLADKVGLGDAVRATGAIVDAEMEAGGFYDQLDDIGEDLAKKVRSADEWITKNADTIALAVSVAAVGAAIVFSGGAVLPAMATGALVGAVSGLVDYAMQARAQGQPTSLLGMANAVLGGAVGGAVQGAFGPGFGTLVGGFASGVLSQFAQNFFNDSVSRAMGGSGVSLTQGLMDAGVSGFSDAATNAVLSEVLPSFGGMPETLSGGLSGGMNQAVSTGIGKIAENLDSGRKWNAGLRDAVVDAAVEGFVSEAVESGMESALSNEVDYSDESYGPLPDRDESSRRTDADDAMSGEPRKSLLDRIPGVGLIKSSVARVQLSRMLADARRNGDPHGLVAYMNGWRTMRDIESQADATGDWDMANQRAKVDRLRANIDRASGKIETVKDSALFSGVADSERARLEVARLNDTDIGKAAALLEQIHGWKNGGRTAWALSSEIYATKLVQQYEAGGHAPQPIELYVGRNFNRESIFAMVEYGVFRDRLGSDAAAMRAFHVNEFNPLQERVFYSQEEYDNLPAADQHYYRFQPFHDWKNSRLEGKSLPQGFVTRDLQGGAIPRALAYDVFKIRQAMGSVK